MPAGAFARSSPTPARSLLGTPNHSHGSPSGAASPPRLLAPCRRTSTSASSLRALCRPAHSASSAPRSSALAPRPASPMRNASSTPPSSAPAPSPRRSLPRAAAARRPYSVSPPLKPPLHRRPFHAALFHELPPTTVPPPRFLFLHLLRISSFASPLPGGPSCRAPSSRRSPTLPSAASSTARCGLDMQPNAAPAPSSSACPRLPPSRLHAGSSLSDPPSRAATITLAGGSAIATHFPTHDRIGVVRPRRCPGGRRGLPANPFSGSEGREGERGVAVVGTGGRRPSCPSGRRGAVRCLLAVLVTSVGYLLDRNFGHIGHWEKQPTVFRIWSFNGTVKS